MSRNAFFFSPVKNHSFSNPDSFVAHFWFLRGGAEIEREEGEPTVHATVLPLGKESRISLEVLRAVWTNFPSSV